MWPGTPTGRGMHPSCGRVAHPGAGGGAHHDAYNGDDSSIRVRLVKAFLKTVLLVKEHRQQGLRS